MTIWIHGFGSMALESFLDYHHQIHSTGKIKFTMQVQDEDGIEILDLKLQLENSKIAVDAFAKPTNSFTYMRYLLVVTLEKVSTIYHLVEHTFETHL